MLMYYQVSIKQASLLNSTELLSELACLIEPWEKFDLQQKI